MIETCRRIGIARLWNAHVAGRRASSQELRGTIEAPQALKPRRLVAVAKSTSKRSHSVACVSMAYQCRM